MLLHPGRDEGSHRYDPSIQPATRRKAAAVASLSQDVFPSATERPWKRSFRRSISSSAPETSRTFPALLSRSRKSKSFVSKPSFLYDEKTPRILSTPSFTAYLKIAEGCSKACTFCTVPRIRGPYRSQKAAVRH